MINNVISLLQTTSYQDTNEHTNSINGVFFL